MYLRSGQEAALRGPAFACVISLALRGHGWQDRPRVHPHRTDPLLGRCLLDAETRSRSGDPTQRRLTRTSRSQKSISTRAATPGATSAATTPLSSDSTRRQSTTPVRVIGWPGATGQGARNAMQAVWGILPRLHSRPTRNASGESATKHFSA